jgi:hypothetical protein
MSRHRRAKSEKDFSFSEWVYRIECQDIGQKPLTYTISANEDQCKAIAERLSINHISDLKATITVSREQGHLLHATGVLTAQVTQSCIYSLEDVVQNIGDEIEAWFSDQEDVIPLAKARHEAFVKADMADLPMLDEQDAPDPVEFGTINLGELVIQFLSLSLDPYPQKEGARPEDFVVLEPDVPSEKLKVNPFEALKNWRPKD